MNRIKYIADNFMYWYVSGVALFVSGQQHFFGLHTGAESEVLIKGVIKR